MHPYFSVMDERWFHRAFVYTGSVTDREKNLDFRYRYEQVKGDDGDALKASTYSDLCYELAQDVEEETFPWTDEGVEVPVPSANAAPAVLPVRSPADSTRSH